MASDPHLFEVWEQIGGPQGPIRISVFMTTPSEHQSVDTYNAIKAYCDLRIRWMKKAAIETIPSPQRRHAPWPNDKDGEVSGVCPHGLDTRLECAQCMNNGEGGKDA